MYTIISMGHEKAEEKVGEPNMLVYLKVVLGVLDSKLQYSRMQNKWRSTSDIILTKKNIQSNKWSWKI